MRFQSKLANSLVRFAQNRFRPIIAMVINFRYITLATFTGLMAMAIMLLTSGIAPSAMLPEVEADMIQFSARFPDLGLTVTEERNNASTKDIADKLEEYIGPIPDAYRVNYGTTEGGGEGRGGLYYGVTSSDPEALKAALLELKEELEGFSAVARAWDSLESSARAREVRFSMKPGAETLGITLSDVTRQVREAFYGREVQRLPRNGEDVRVMVRYPTAARESRVRTHSPPRP